MLAWTVAVLLLAAEAAPAPETRTLQLWVSDAKGRPIDDLTANEIAVRQDGKARPVVSVERETGPLTVALVVDTSAVFDDSFRSQLRPALEGFVRRLPAGTRFCVWTSGDRPTRWVDWTTDADAAGAVLGRIAPTGGNLLFETIDEALGDLGDARGGRATLVIVTGLGTEFSVGEQPRAFEERERRAGVVIHAVQIAEPPLTFQRPNADESQSPFRRRANYERALGRLTEETGGRYYTAAGARKLASEISYSEAGITTRETKDIWNMPAVFLLALLLRGSEWVLRRQWGVV